MARRLLETKQDSSEKNWKQRPWTPQKYQAFRMELDRAGQEIQSRLGQEDVRYLLNLDRKSRYSQIVGRALLHVSLDPLTWSMGILFLWFHKQLDTTLIGHAALHGAWDQFKGLEKFHSSRHRWNTPIEEESWKRVHNILHHQFTNIVGKDPDLSFGKMRLSKQTPWSPFHLFQSSQFFLTAPFFTWILNLYFTGLVDLIRRSQSQGYADILPDRNFKTILKAARLSLKKMTPYFLYNYVLWPALAGPLGFKVLLGNMIADGMRNILSCSAIYTNHFSSSLEYYDSDFRAHSRAEWQKAQIESTQNFKLSLFVALMAGELNYQIEHHLFPKLPPNRLKEIAPKIEAICEKYGVRYNKEKKWSGALGNALKRIAHMSLP